LFGRLPRCCADRREAQKIDLYKENERKSIFLDQTVSLVSDLLDKNGQILGRLAVVLSFEYLVKNVVISGWWQSFEGFLVDNHGKILTGTVPGKRNELAETNEPLEREALRAIKQRPYGTLLGSGHPPAEVGGFYKLQEAPWTLVMIAPRRIILAPILRFRLYYFITDVNRLITADTRESGHFMTLFYAEIDPSLKNLHWVRAGHDPAFFYDPTSDDIEELRGEGMALGIDANCAYRQSAKTGLSPGQILLIGTDGIWETRDDFGRMFGKTRLADLIREQASDSSERLIQAIMAALRAFRGSAKQEDDVALAVVKIVDEKMELGVRLTEG
jgi:hypothetical protein